MSPRRAAARDDLVAAAKRLIWERGVEATSPGALLAESGVGQGSLYHHFAGKPDWARAAIEGLADDLEDETSELLGDASRPGIDRLRDYLDKPRAALAGCRLGRLAFDPQVAGTPVLREPLTDYFARLLALLRSAATDAVAEGDLSASVRPAELAHTFVAVVQGGYVSARSLDDEGAMTSAIAGLHSLLGAAAPHDGGDHR